MLQVVFLACAGYLNFTFKDVEMFKNRVGSTVIKNPDVYCLPFMLTGPTWRRYHCVNCGGLL